jgi:hypothetical protein
MVSTTPLAKESSIANADKGLILADSLFHLETVQEVRSKESSALQVYMVVQNVLLPGTLLQK